MSDAERAASDACMEQSDKKVITASADGSDLVKKLQGEARAYAVRDSRVVALRERWIQCMADKRIQCAGSGGSCGTELG